MKASIIIPFYDCFDLVFQRLAELAALGVPDNIEVILANDGSEDIKTYLMLEKARLTFPFFKTVGYEEHRGFSSVNNLAAREAEGDILCFLSDDVKILAPFWKCFTLMERRWLGGMYLQRDTGWNKFDGSVFYYLEGWFVACLKSEFEAIGGWDEKFDPHDYEDIDLSLRARLAGYSLEEMPPGFVQHLGCGTLGRKKSIEDRKLITERNRKYFQEKWADHIGPAVIA